MISKTSTFSSKFLTKMFKGSRRKRACYSSSPLHKTFNRVLIFLFIFIHRAHTSLSCLHHKNFFNHLVEINLHLRGSPNYYYGEPLNWALVNLHCFFFLSKHCLIYIPLRSSFWSIMIRIYSKISIFKHHYFSGTD